MSTIINGTSSAITFPDSSVQNTSAIVSGYVPYANLPAGSVLQVVNGTTSTDTTIASTTFTDTTLTATITPKFATSKILILISQQYNVNRTNVENGQGIQIVRNGSSIFAPDSSYGGGYIFAGGTTSIVIAAREFLQYLDSPASTSALTYKTQGKTDNTANGGQVRYQVGGTTSVITLLEIAA